MKWQQLLILIVILTGMAICSDQAVLASAGPEDILIEQQAERLQTDALDAYWEQLMKEYESVLPDKQPPSLMDILTGREEGFSVREVMHALLRYFFHELIYNGKLLITIVLITVFSILLETIQSAFERKSVSKVAYAVSYLVLMIIAMNSFSVAIGYAKSAISSMIHFMVAMVPLLLTLLASMGNLVTVSVLHPLIVFMIHTIGTLIYTTVFPLLFISAVIHLVSSMTDRYKLTQLANLFRHIGIGLLGVMLTAFLGVISVQGATSSTTDGVTIRTAKYITGNFVPVVGRMFSDASDTVIGASLLIKNSIGLVGVLILFMLCAFPALKILALALIYNVSAAVLQPLGSTPISQCLSTIGKSLIYVFAALAAVGFMFFLAVTILIAAGNVSVMMR
ncbi:stage III sporulation protein AE [Marinicrinis sediminis]|uniref:Stage III sporulation protein AE n=1 Tax=Marinicrinis sediminis TaxID=1652465 RepID=A0ABW5RFF6_9BACL